MPPEVRQIDDLWSRFVRFKEHASYRTLKPEEGITPQAYQQAVKQNSMGDTFAKGTAVGQDLSDPAQILRMSPNSGLSMLAGTGAAALGHLAGGAPLSLGLPAVAAAGSTRPVARYALGGYDWQKDFRRILDEELAAAFPIIGASGAQQFKE